MRYRSSAFTLLELMIAIGLGTLIVYASFAGLRTATQTITIANRLSLENTMLQAGFVIALDELDTWRAYDDPDSTDPTERRQRETGNGLLFRPLTRIAPRPAGIAPERRERIRPTPANLPPVSAVRPLADLPYQSAEALRRVNPNINAINGLAFRIYDYSDDIRRDSDDDTLWDPHYFWPANDPRTWWRANPVEYNETIGRNGHYSLFANSLIDPSPGPSGRPLPFVSGQSMTYLWLFNQMHMLQEQLGYYAFCDYLPPSMLYSYITKQTSGLGVTTKNDMAFDFTRAGNGKFRAFDGGGHFAQGRLRCTKDVTFIAVPLRPQMERYKGSIPPRADFTFNQTLKFETGNTSDENDLVGTKNFKDFFGLSVNANALLKQRPESWPDISVDVARFLSHCRFVNLFNVRWTNAHTGESISLSFTGIGTTLRGARNMRKPYLGSSTAPQGWATWRRYRTSSAPPIGNSATIDNPDGIQPW
jgi:hypothetical protein